MTTTESPPPGPTRDPADTLCAQCGAELDDDQEWCLECGGARTMIHRAPDWRVPVVVIGLVAAVAIAALVVALLNTSGNANSAANATLPVPAPSVPARTTTARTTTAAAHTGGKASATTATTATTATSQANIAGWPAGLPGWTVVLAHSKTQQIAYADAARIATAGIQVGVLDSTEHPKLAPGYWVVFSGRYPTRAEALVAAERLISLGQTRAHPRLVGRVGAA